MSYLYLLPVDRQSRYIFDLSVRLYVRAIHRSACCRLSVVIISVSVRRTAKLLLLVSRSVCTLVYFCIAAMINVFLRNQGLCPIGYFYPHQVNPLYLF